MATMATDLDESGNGWVFLKMHGLGNDFVIIDAREDDIDIRKGAARALGNRHFGVGFDQLVVMGKSTRADVHLSFWNSDGGKANACGNASRCVARLLMAESGKDTVVLETGNGLLPAVMKADESGKSGESGKTIWVNMGQPQLDWRDIPLAKAVDIDALPLDDSPSAVGMGNPHCVFITDDVAGIDVPRRGAAIEKNPLFPQSTNVEFVQVLTRDSIKMRVWERGGMMTFACGSGACAAVVASHRKGLINPRAEVVLDGGTLQIDWRDDGVWMGGETALIFRGVLSRDFMEGFA